MLTYAQQVLELEKVARLERRAPTVPREPPPPLQASGNGDALCLVCTVPHARRCTACGAVSYCSEQHQQVDAVWHDAVCSSLRDSAEDAELVRSGSFASLSAEPAARYFEPQLAASARERVLTDFASRPLTLARVLRELALAPGPVVRVHVMAASAKELESLAFYGELPRLWPGLDFDIALIGPELPSSTVVEAPPGVRFALHQGNYSGSLWPRLGRPDLIIGFNAGLLLYRSWQATLTELIGCGVPFAITSYRSWEAQGEAKLLASLGATPLLAPEPNPFASLCSRASSTLVNDVSRDNAFLSVWR